MSGQVYAAHAADASPASTVREARYVAKTASNYTALALVREATVLRMLMIRARQSAACATIFEEHIPHIRELYVPAYLRTGPLKQACDDFDNAEQLVARIDQDAMSTSSRRVDASLSIHRLAIHTIRERLGLPIPAAVETYEDWTQRVSAESTWKEDCDPLESVSSSYASLIALAAHEIAERPYCHVATVRAAATIDRSVNIAVAAAAELRKKARARHSSESDSDYIEQNEPADGELDDVVLLSDCANSCEEDDAAADDDDDHDDVYAAHAQTRMPGVFPDSCHVIMDKFDMNAKTALSSAYLADESRRDAFCWAVYQTGVAALTLLHSLNFVHRDLKPDNFLVSVSAPQKGQPVKWRIALADFGCAVQQWFSWSTDEVYAACQAQLPLSDADPVPQKVHVIGNICHASLESMHCLPPRCAWDMESLLYVIACMRFDELPWSTRASVLRQAAFPHTVSNPSVHATHRALFQSLRRRKRARWNTVQWLLLKSGASHHIGRLGGALRAGLHTVAAGGDYWSYSSLFQCLHAQYLHPCSAYCGGLPVMYQAPLGASEYLFSQVATRHATRAAVLRTLAQQTPSAGLQHRVIEMGCIGSSLAPVADATATTATFPIQSPVIAESSQLLDDSVVDRTVQMLDAFPAAEQTPLAITEPAADGAHKPARVPTPLYAARHGAPITRSNDDDADADDDGDDSDYAVRAAPSGSKKRTTPKHSATHKLVDAYLSRKTPRSQNARDALALARSQARRNFDGYSNWNPVLEPWHAWLPQTERRQRRKPARYDAGDV